jgi:hypothetical protein
VTLKFTRLGASPEEPFCTELIGWWPDATAVSAHLGRLRGLHFVAQNSWILTDDVEVYFEYRDHHFVVESPFAHLWLTALSADMPEQVFREVEAHVLEYQTVWPHQYAAAAARNLLLPRKPPVGWRRLR